MSVPTVLNNHKVHAPYVLTLYTPRLCLKYAKTFSKSKRKFVNSLTVKKE